MSNQSDKVKEWRRHTKEKMVQAMGGKCQICEYHRCYDALDLHHVDPALKQFSFSSVMAKPTKWENIIEELKKCILLCAVCHREFHAGIVSLPDKYQQFDDKLITAYKGPLFDLCPICGDEKNALKITCSRKCAAKKSCIVDWDNVDLFNLLKHNTKTQIAEMLGISDSAVIKRLKKLEAQL